MEGLGSVEYVAVLYHARHHGGLSHKPKVIVNVTSQPTRDQSTTFLDTIDLPRTFEFVLLFVGGVLLLRVWLHRKLRRSQILSGQRINTMNGGQSASRSTDRAALRNQLSEVMVWMEEIENALARYCQKPEAESVAGWIRAARGQRLHPAIAASMSRINYQRNRLVHDHTALSCSEWEEVSTHWANIQRYFTP